MTLKRREFLASCAALAIYGVATPQISPSRQLVDKLVAKAMRELPIRGISIVVAHDGNPIIATGYGFADQSARVRVTDTTIFPIGSVTKTFTAAATLSMRDQGLLDIDLPVSRYVAESPHGDSISLKMLLEQRSGLADLYGDFAWEQRMRDATAEQMLNTVRDRPLDFEPSTRFEYSNTNYLLLGIAIERVAGIPLAEILKNRVINPAGLTETGIIGDGPGVRAVGYQRQTDPRGAPVDIPNGGRMYWGAGALASSASDLARWDAALLRGQILRPSSVKEMMTPALPEMPERYAMGWFVDVFNGEPRVRHEGNVPGFSCTNDVFVARKLSVTVMSNLSRIPIERLADRIELALFGMPDEGGAIF
jgi:D-alanyl-D-alanine carboxypeptidase